MPIPEWIAKTVDPVLVAEAYEHGRTQGRLGSARDGLQAILRMAKGKSELAIRIRREAERALIDSDPERESRG